MAQTYVPVRIWFFRVAILSWFSVFMSVATVQAATVNYQLENVFLDDGQQMTGIFAWTYNVGDFENGVGQFSSLDIPHTLHDQTDLIATIEIGQIEITFDGNVHDDGVDITLVLLQDFTPTTQSSIDLVLSKYSIGGNGFNDGIFQSGTITPIIAAVPAPTAAWLFGSGLLGLIGISTCKKIT